MDYSSDGNLQETLSETVRSLPEYDMLGEIISYLSDYDLDTDVITVLNNIAKYDTDLRTHLEKVYSSAMEGRLIEEDLDEMTEKFSSLYYQYLDSSELFSLIKLVLVIAFVLALPLILFLSSQNAEWNQIGGGLVAVANLSALLADKIRKRSRKGGIDYSVIKKGIEELEDLLLQINEEFKTIAETEYSEYLSRPHKDISLPDLLKDLEALTPQEAKLRLGSGTYRTISSEF